MLGKMVHWIHIMSKATEKDPSGFDVFVRYDHVMSIRATMERKKANEFWANIATFSKADTLFRFRKKPGIGIDASMAILIGNLDNPLVATYNILSVDEIKGAGLYYEVFAELIAPSRG
jgi:hypothetical protein